MQIPKKNLNSCLIKHMCVLVFVPMLLLPAKSMGQNFSPPISLSYFSPYLIQPGLKLGTSFQLKDFSNKEKNRSLEISPEIAYFTQAGVSQSYLLNADIHLYRKIDGRKRFQKFGLGLGYLIDSEDLTPLINLGSGSLSSNEKANNASFLPSLNYSLGILPDKGLAYFFKGFVGHKLPFSKQGEFFFGLELGLIFNPQR
ncbi:MAG: hypothetical protein AAF696_18090 [Bacteroidota bacterium]